MTGSMSTASLNDAASIQSFAVAVNDAARLAPARNLKGEARTGLCGVAFICDVAAMLGCTVVDAAPFLLAAQRAGLIEMSRCDLVQAYRREDVEASEVTYLNACFHFVRMP